MSHKSHIHSKHHNSGLSKYVRILHAKSNLWTLELQNMATANSKESGLSLPNHLELVGDACFQHKPPRGWCRSGSSGLDLIPRVSLSRYRYVPKTTHLDFVEGHLPGGVQSSKFSGREAKSSIRL